MGLGRVWFVATAFCLLGASSACDSAGGNDGMFGGDAGSNAFNDTWRYDLEALTSTMVPVN